MTKVALSKDLVGIKCDFEGNTNIMSWKVKREGGANLSITTQYITHYLIAL
jgi:hypothetical protein